MSKERKHTHAKTIRMDGHRATDMERNGCVSLRGTPKKTRKRRRKGVKKAKRGIAF